MIFLLEKR